MAVVETETVGVVAYRTRPLSPPRSLQRHDQITRLSAGCTWPHLDVHAQIWHGPVQPCGWPVPVANRVWEVFVAGAPTDATARLKLWFEMAREDAHSLSLLISLCPLCVCLGVCLFVLCFFRVADQVVCCVSVFICDWPSHAVPSG